MTPTSSLLCLALLSSTIGMTLETADDFNGNSKNISQNSFANDYNLDKFNIIRNKKESRTKINENLNDFILSSNKNKENNGDIIPREGAKYLISNKSDIKTVDFIDNNKTDVTILNSLKLSHVKPYKGKVRSWLMDHKKDMHSQIIPNYGNTTLSRARRQDKLVDPCDEYRQRVGVDTCNGFNEVDLKFSHPGPPEKYCSNMDCVLVLNAPSTNENYVITLDFRDKFHLEDHPNCTYDFLEIRDGNKGYSKLIDKFCGNNFPKMIQSQGPSLWLRFQSDSTIEYEGFNAVIVYERISNSKKPIPECEIELEETYDGVIERVEINPDCLKASKSEVDVLWIVNVKPTHKIFLNFTQFSLAYPNECNMNFVEVFGEKTEMTNRLNNFCGSMADTITSTGNILHVRFFAVSKALPKTNFSAHYTAIRSRTEASCEGDEFDCDDATCIDISLKCNKYANCRLKGDEDVEVCKPDSEKMLQKTHIVIILVIFSLILSSMSFVFVFKCIKKLVADHKIIKEHIRQSCEDRLDTIAGSKLALDPRLLQRDSLQRERDSLRRDNHRNNEMYKRQRTKNRPGSIESDNPSETHVDIDDDSWPLDIEDNGETGHRHSRENSAKPKSKEKRDTKPKGDDREMKELKDGKELRHKKGIDKGDTIDRRGNIERKLTKDKREISDRKDTIDNNASFDRKDPTDRRGTIDRRRTMDSRGTLEKKGTIDQDIDETDLEQEDSGKRNVSVGTPDMKESGCQTRESLFQGENCPSPDGTDSSGTRGFSTFGYSGSTLLPARSPHPAPPPALTVELLQPCKPQPPPKKIPDRRPMSTETTRSAPDVIIVSKPVR